MSIEKIFRIEDHIGCATSGLVADARVLVDRARIDAQINRITFDEKIQVKALVKRICDFKQTYTRYGGVRPFGTALLIGGIDNKGAHLFATDPSGAMMEYKATAEGEGRDVAMKFFEKNYNDGLKKDDAILLGIKALYEATEKKLKKEAVGIGIVSDKEDFHIISQKESENYVGRVVGS